MPASANEMIQTSTQRSPRGAPVSWPFSRGRPPYPRGHPCCLETLTLSPGPSHPGRSLPPQFHEHLGVTMERKRSCPGGRGRGALRAGLQERDNPLALAPGHLTRPRGWEPGPGTRLGTAAEQETGPHKERVPWKWR
uniref:Uncharacterized protein n=1 Tax=Rangifer tarandus platyrhynchus TaxID=3082113 RepID=A0ACB0E8W1_RANTA|nr:unnamed protein product [Rangifer tarandus platyrhynchus]